MTRMTLLISRTAALVGVVAGAGWGAGLGAQSPDSLFQSGNAAYQDGRFDEARTTYESVLDAGYGSGALYYNLGNAYFKLGDLGRAVLSYERARRLEPGDEDVRANLELANSLLADEITPLPAFLPARVLRWLVEFLPRSLVVLLSVSGYVLAGLFGAAWIMVRAPALRRSVGWVAGIAGLAAVLFGANLAARAWLAGRETQAVILADEVDVYSAPSEERSLQLFTIHEGTKVRIDQQSGEWAEIVLLDGQVGWVRTDAFETI